MITQYLPPKIIKTREHFKLNYASTKHIPMYSNIQIHNNKHHNSTEAVTQRNTQKQPPQFLNKKSLVLKHRSLRSTINRITIDENKQNIKPSNNLLQNTQKIMMEYKQSCQRKKSQSDELLQINNKIKAIRKYQKGIKQQTKQLLLSKQCRVFDMDKIISKNNKILQEILKITQLQNILPNFLSSLADFGYVYENLTKKLIYSHKEFREKLQKNPYSRISDLQKEIQQLTNRYTQIYCQQSLIKRNELPQKQLQTISKINFYKINQNGFQNLFDFTFSNTKIQDTLSSVIQEYLKSNNDLDVCLIKQFKNVEQTFTFISGLYNKQKLSLSSQGVIEQLQIPKKLNNIRQRQLILQKLRVLFKNNPQNIYSLSKIINGLTFNSKYLNSSKKNEIFIQLLRYNLDENDIISIYLGNYRDSLQKNYESLIEKLKLNKKISEETISHFNHLKKSDKLSEYINHFYQNTYPSINIDSSTCLFICFYYYLHQLQSMKIYFKMRLKNDSSLFVEIISPKYKLDLANQQVQNLQIWAKKIQLVQKIAESCNRTCNIDYFEEIYRNILIEDTVNKLNKQLKKLILLE